MLTRTDLRGHQGDLSAVVPRPSGADPAVVEVVREIIASVRERGDTALRELTERFDECVVLELRVPNEELTRALEGLDPALRVALEFASDQIIAYHESHATPTCAHERHGIHVRELVVPVDRAGLYVPGGRAAYPSSVLMTAIPAVSWACASWCCACHRLRYRQPSRRDTRGRRARRASTRCTGSVARRRSRRWPTAPSRSARST